MTKRIFVSGLLGLLILTGCSSTADVTPSASVDPSLTADPANPDASNAPDASEYPGFNEEIVSAKIVFEVRNVTCGYQQVGSEPTIVKAVGQFCLVQLDITNNSKREYVFIGNDQVLYDNESQPYEMDASAAIFVNDSNSLGYRLPKGETASAILPYDVPLDVQLAGLLLKADSTVDGKLMLFQNR